MATEKDEKVAIMTVIDGSEESRRAARFASELARRASARLVVVVPAVPKPTPALVHGRALGEAKPAVEAAARSAAFDEAGRQLHAVREELDAAVPVEFVVAETRGTVTGTILDHLDPARTLMVVVPRRQPRLLMRVLGDDVPQLVKRCPVPVTLTP